MEITSQLYHIFIEPFPQGVDNIKACLSGKRVEQIFQQAVGDAQPSREIDLSLFQRIGALVIGVILLIPLINAVAFAILQAINSSFVFQRHPEVILAQAPPLYVHPNPLAPPFIGAQQPLLPGEVYLQRKNEGLALVPDAPVLQEPLVTAEEYRRRKNEALDQLPNYPAENHPQFACSNEVIHYNLDAVLQRFDANHNPERLAELFDYSEFDHLKRWNLTEHLRIYSHPILNNAQEKMTKVLLSKLFDFFHTNRPLFPVGTEQEALFKAEIRNVFDRIIDAHGNCVDQVLSQMESIVSDTIADFESIQGQGIRTLRDRIINRTAFTLFKYRTDLIRHICAVEYPGERHMADMERLVKQRLAGMMGMQGGVFDVGARYNIIDNPDQKVENIVHILMFGEASNTRIMEDVAQGAINDTKTARRRGSKYNPEQYLINALKSYYGAARTFRGDVFVWVRQHFNLEANDELTANFIRALSDDPDGLNASEGGNLTHQATLFLLERLGIFTNNNIAAAV